MHVKCIFPFDVQLFRMQIRKVHWIILLEFNINAPQKKGENSKEIGASKPVLRMQLSAVRATFIGHFTWQGNTHMHFHADCRPHILFSLEKYSPLPGAKGEKQSYDQ